MFQVDGEEREREMAGRDRGNGRKRKEKGKSEAVMCIPHTPKGELRRKLQGINEMEGLK